MTIYVRWRLTGQEWQEKEYPDERLDEILERAWRAFGDPTRDLQSTKKENESGSQPIRTRRRKK